MIQFTFTCASFTIPAPSLKGISAKTGELAKRENKLSTPKAFLPLFSKAFKILFENALVFVKNFCMFAPF